MTDMTGCLDAIEAVFEQEAEYIVGGKLVELSELTKPKLEHLTILSNAIESGALVNASPGLLERVKKVQATASEHSKHLEAMRHGLRRILTRMGRLESDTLVGSYNAYGDRVRFSDAVGQFKSKA